MQIIDFVRAKVAAGGEVGAKVACRVPLIIDQMGLVSTWNRSPYGRSHFRTPYSEGCFRRKYGRIRSVGSSALAIANTQAGNLIVLLQEKKAPKRSKTWKPWQQCYHSNQMKSSKSPW